MIKSQEFLFEKAPFSECHASTIVEIEDGNFLVAFFAGTREGEKDVSIWTVRNEDSSWLPPVKVAWDDEAPCWNPVLFKDQAGRIWLFYKIGHSPESWSGVYLKSEAPFASWSEPHYLPAGLLGPAKNKPIIMSNNEILCGSSVESYKAWSCWAEVFDVARGHWHKFGPVYYEGVNKGVIQPSALEISEGRLKMFMRSTQRIGRVCVADSFDYGRTWSRARTTSLPNPNSGIDVVALRSGTLVIVYNDSTISRSPLSLAASKDDGDTWQKILDLETGEGEFSYPSVILAEDGSLHITYTWMRRRIKHVVLNAEEIESTERQESCNDSRK